MLANHLQSIAISAVKQILSAESTLEIIDEDIAVEREVLVQTQNSIAGLQEVKSDIIDDLSKAEQILMDLSPLAGAGVVIDGKLVTYTPRGVQVAENIMIVEDTLYPGMTKAEALADEEDVTLIDDECPDDCDLSCCNCNTDPLEPSAVASDDWPMGCPVDPPECEEECHSECEHGHSI